MLASPGDAAFANATMGHGLVREDMHAASICHHGVVVWPTLLALSERTSLSGATFLAAAIIGYWSIGLLLRILRTRTTLVFIVLSVWAYDPGRGMARSAAVKD